MLGLYDWMINLSKQLRLETKMNYSGRPIDCEKTPGPFFFPRFLTILFALLIALPAAAQIQYQFQDQPRPEADIVMVNHTLQVRGSADVWMVGRVFNRGLKPARNVRVVPLLTNLYGSRLPSNTFYLNPSDVPPTSFANFEARVGSSMDVREVISHATAEWDP